MHNAVELELDQILGYCGYFTVREERNLFATLDKRNQRKPDITIKNPETLYLPGEQIGAQVLVDVSITCCMEGAGRGQLIPPTSLENSKKEKGKAAKKVYNDKVRDYKGLFTRLNLDQFSIVPFVFESTGFLHEKSMDLLETVAQRAEEVKKIPRENMFTFFKKRLSICLMKNVAHCIIGRGSKLMARNDFYFDRTFDHRVIAEEDLPIA